MLVPFLALAALLTPQVGRQAEPAVSLSAAEVAAGGTVELRLDFTIQPGWHVYDPADVSGAGLPPSVELVGAGVTAAGPLRSEAAPKKHVETIGGRVLTQLWLEGRPRMVLPVTVSAPPGELRFEAVVRWAVCNERMCLPPTSQTFPLTLRVTGGGGQEAAAAAPVEEEVEELGEPTGEVQAEWDFPRKWKQGETYVLKFTLDVNSGWHIYHPESPDGFPTLVDFVGSGFEVLGKPTTSAKPRKVTEASGDVYLWLEGKPSFEVPVKVTGDPAVSGGRLRIRWLACNESLCLNTEGVEFEVGTPSANGAAAGATDPTGAAGGSAGGLAAGGFWSFLLLAIGAGLFTLLTPCVFPMIPVTISYFTKRADEGKGTPVGNATAYAGGIVFTFAGIGVGAALLIGPSGANAIGSNPWINLGIGALFVWMALSLLGFYEIQAPRFLQNFASRTQSEGRSKGGYLPVVLMAIAFSITAFTCTVGFVGAIFATGLNLGIAYLLGGMLVYGAVFALPFFFLALFPSWLKSLPQAGGWMNVVKVSAGFIELIAAIKFFSNTDLRFNLHVLTWPVAVGLTILFLLLWAAYMFGLYRTHHDYDKARPGAARVGVGVGALGLAAFLAPGLWDHSENAYAGGWVEAYMPPAEYGDEKYALDGGVIKAGGLSWQTSYQRAWDIAVAEDKPLFLDFTGVTCVNCRKMEYSIFPHPDVVPLLGAMARAELWVDKPPFGRWNTQLELDRFQQASQPLYAVIDPRDDAVLAEKKDGYDPDPAVFVAFLKSGLDAYASRTPGPPPAGGAYHERIPPPDGEEWHFPWIGTLALLGLLTLAVAWLIFALIRVELHKRRDESALAAA